MKKLDESALYSLIEIYSDLQKRGVSRKIREKARKIYDALTPASTLLDKRINIAVANLFGLAYPDADPERPVPKKEKIEEILSVLYAIQKEYKG